MKLTKSTLKKLIKEEIENLLDEEGGNWWDDDLQTAGEHSAALQAVGDMASMSAGFSSADGRSMDANEMGVSSAEDHLGLDVMTPDQARRAINTALKAGEIDKDDWRRLRRKYHRKNPRRKSSVNRDALDKMGAKEDPRLPTQTPEEIAKRKGFLPGSPEFKKSVAASTRRG